MKFGIFTINQNFLQFVREELEAKHDVIIWHRVGVEDLDWINLYRMMDLVDVAYFDWAQTPYIEALGLLHPKCKIAVRARGVSFYTNYKVIPWHRTDLVIGHNKIRWKLEELPAKKQPKAFLELPEGIDTQLFQLPKNKRYGKTLATHNTVIRFVKRLYTTLQTFYELLKHDNEWIFHIAGDWEGGWRESRRREFIEPTKELIEYLDLDDKLQCVKHMQDKKDWHRWLRTKDIYVNNSMREGTGIASLEAMASGTYTLTNCWKGVDEYFPKECIFRTQTELLEKIIEWRDFTDKKKRKLSKEMHDWACTKFDGREIARKMVRAMEALVE